MKISVGKHKITKKKTAYPERIVFMLGILLMCAMLIAPLLRAGEDHFSADAVLVMSDPEREKVMLPEDKSASAEKKWSFYDYIGEIFAELLFGEG